MTLGATPPPRGSSGFCEVGIVNSSIVQVSAATGNYQVPAGGGVITQWSHQASGEPNQVMRLRLFRANGGASFTAVGESADQRMTPSTLNSFPARVPVTGGELIGLKNGDFPDENGACVYTSTGNVVDLAYYSGDNVNPPLNTPATYVPLTSELSTYLVNVSVRVEPDADHDDFGDETQDQCPTNATTAGACPPAAAPPAAAPTGERAGALEKCKKKAKKKDWTKTQLKKCKKKANLLPV